MWPYQMKQSIDTTRTEKPKFVSNRKYFTILFQHVWQILVKQFLHIKAVTHTQKYLSTSIWNSLIRYTTHSSKEKLINKMTSVSEVCMVYFNHTCANNITTYILMCQTKKDMYNFKKYEENFHIFFLWIMNIVNIYYCYIIIIIRNCVTSIKVQHDYK